MIEITNRIALDYQKRLAEQREKREIEKQKAKEEYAKTGNVKIDVKQVQSDLVKLSTDAKECREKTSLAIQKNQISWKYRGFDLQQMQEMMSKEEKEIMNS